MPMLPMRVCGRCSVNLTRRTPCDACKARIEQRRGTASQRGYGAEHRRRRALVLARDPLCVACEAQGRVEPSTVDDHIIPIEQGGSVDDLSNHQGLCARCHNVKRAAESRGQRMVVAQGIGLMVTT